MRYGLQTHIESWVSPDILAEIRAKGFNAARISAMEADWAVVKEMLDQAREAGFEIWLTTGYAAYMNLLLPGENVECRNEDDGDLTPWEYRQILDRFAVAAGERGLKLWGPTISNLDRDSLWWARLVKGMGWPEGMYGVSVHRYGNGTFEKPHEGFDNRHDEADALRELADGLPYAITEFGYPTIHGLSEADQAERVGKEWQFWKDEGATAAFLFQRTDGPDPNEREHCYGIQRIDGSWKPAADTIPKEDL